MSGAGSLRVAGAPSGAPAWRSAVADAASAGPTPEVAAQRGLVLDLVLRPRQFVDLDTLAQNALAGLRDAGWLSRGMPELDVLVATKGEGAPPDAGVHIRAVPAADLARRPPPGPVAVEAASSDLPGTTRDGKRAWRDVLAAAWGDAAPLGGPVWAEVALAVPGSVVAPLEPILDALEPVLGRDPRGRAWQEFFPADDRITWLRVQRAHPRPDGPLLRLRLGPVGRR